MSTSIILLDQDFNANDVDIMVFEPSVLFPPVAVWGGIDDMVQISCRLFRKYMYQDTILNFNNLKQAHTDSIYITSKKKTILSDSKCSGELFCENYFEIKV